MRTVTRLARNATRNREGIWLPYEEVSLLSTRARYPIMDIMFGLVRDEETQMKMKRLLDFRSSLK